MLQRQHKKVRVKDFEGKHVSLKVCVRRAKFITVFIMGVLKQPLVPAEVLFRREGIFIKVVFAAG